MSRIGTTPIEVPANVKVNLDPAKCTHRGRGPEGQAVLRVPPRGAGRTGTRARSASCARSPKSRVRDRPVPRALGHDSRSRIQNMIIGVTEGYQIEGPRDRRRRLERTAAGQDAPPEHRLLPPDRHDAAGRRRVRRSRRTSVTISGRGQAGGGAVRRERPLEA